MEGRALLVTLGAAWLLAAMGSEPRTDLLPSTGALAGTDVVLHSPSGPARAHIAPQTPAPLVLASLGQAGGRAVGTSTRRLSRELRTREGEPRP